MTPLILNDATPIHWAVASGVIAAVTLSLLLVGNRRLGVSGGLDDICSLVLSRPYFGQASVRASRGWRSPFLVGLLLGGFISALVSGGWAPTWDLGHFDQAIGFGSAGKLAWMFGGGMLIGFGTRLAATTSRRLTSARQGRSAARSRRPKSIAGPHRRTAVHRE